MVPAVALKLMLGSYLLAKAGAAGGLVGAGTGLIGKNGEESPDPAVERKRGYHIFFKENPHKKRD